MFNTIQLAKSSQTPLYMQLANGLAQFIENGQLVAGSKLPSIRSLARDLKINRDTVVSAYKVLEQKNLAYGQTGRGTYVSSLPSQSPANHLPLEAFSLDHKDLINFSSISLANEYCPIEIFEEMASHIFKERKWECFYDYTGKQYEGLAYEVCQYFLDHSILCHPKQIRIIESLPQLLQSLPRATNKAGICVESPCKDPSLFKAYGFEPFYVPLEKDGMNTEILESYLKTGKIRYVWVNTYLQNPTGLSYSAEKKDQLLRLAKQYNTYIIEEDTFSELLLGDYTYSPIYTQSSANNVIYIKHFSRLYLPDLHYSFAILPKALTHLIIKPRPYNFTDSLVFYYLQDQRWLSYKNTLIEHYHHKYLRLCHLVDLHLSPYFSYDWAYGGVYLWLTLKASHISLDDLCDLLLANGILVSPSSLFYRQKTNSHSIRLSVARTDMLKLEKGVMLMASILSASKFK